MAQLHFAKIETDINHFIDETYRREFIKAFAKEFKLASKIRKIIKSDPDSLLPVMTQFVQVATERIEKKRKEIRAPIYRIVNAADGVPRVPPSWVTHCIVFLVSFINRELADCLERNFCGYMHQGDMRYLTACERNVSKLEVIPNLGMPFRVFRLARRMIANGPSIAGKDHRISEYQSKLKSYAKKRTNT